MKSLESSFYQGIKISVSLFFILLTSSTHSLAQSFEQGLDLYKQDKFEKAATIFSTIDTDEGLLFAGKAYLGSGKYITAKAFLDQLATTDSQAIFDEAQYTSALADFQLGQYGSALNKLYQLQQAEIRTQVINNGIQLYHDILNYLTINQRKNAFQQATSKQLKIDIIISAFGKVEYPIANTLYAQLQNARIDTAVSDRKEILKMLSNSQSRAVKNSYSSTLQAPNGITYNIGAALPSYSSSEPEFEVSRGLYFGYILAAEQFNEKNSDKKAFIRYQNTGIEVDSADYTMADFAWNFNADAVLGPLFSKSAKSMVRMAEQYQIPLITPLANSDSLNIDNPYVYQANPTFASHGRTMARYAVRHLGMDTLAVIAGKKSSGKISAFAFREEAENLGAKIVHFFVEDLESTGYQISNYIQRFTSIPSSQSQNMNEEDVKSKRYQRYRQLDGVYAPFTGQAASTLIDQLLIELNATNSNLTVMGSQEWGKVNIPDDRLVDRSIYFSESYFMDEGSPRMAQFKKSFNQRFDIEPNRFAMIGYDAATYLLQTLDKVGNPALLKNALKEQPLYKGVISDINFKGTHVNQQVKIFSRSTQGVQPVRQ